MKRASIVGVAVLGWAVAACSSKSERGSGGDGTADNPAVGANAAPQPKPSESPQAGARPERHVLMVVELSLATGTARVLKARAVELPLPRRRGPTPRGPWQVDVLDARGHVLYTAPLPDGSTVRAELENERGELQGTHVPKQLASVTLRLPVLQQAANVRVTSLTDERGAIELGTVRYPAVSP